MISNTVFEEPTASELAEKRRTARGNRRLTYDCMNGIVQGNRVICKKGHKLPSPGGGQQQGLDLLSVIRGRSSNVCQTCKDYDGEEIE